jgi:hypothetical protein
VQIFGYVLSGSPRKLRFIFSVFLESAFYFLDLFRLSVFKKRKELLQIEGINRIKRLNVADAVSTFTEAVNNQRLKFTLARVSGLNHLESPKESKQRQIEV